MIVVLDIETLHPPREEWARMAGIDLITPPPEGQAESEQIDQAEARERQKKQDNKYERAAFDGTFSRIVCIGLLMFSDTMKRQYAMSWYGANEKEILRQFWARLKDIRPLHLITHNGLNFDLPFIKKRSIIHQVRPSHEINLARFRTDSVYDTMAVWSNWDMRSSVKLDVLARALHVEPKSGSGGHVADMWEKGQGKAIAEYCLQDAYVTYACYQRMTFQPPLPSDEILKDPELIEVS